MNNQRNILEQSRSDEYIENAIIGELKNSFLKDYIDLGFVVFSYTFGSTLNGINYNGEINNNLESTPKDIEDLLITITDKYSNNIPNRDTVFKFKTEYFTLLINYINSEKYSFYVNIDGVVKRDKNGELFNLEDSDSLNLKSASINMEIDSKVEYAVHRIRHEINKTSYNLGLEGDPSVSLIILSELTRHYTEEMEIEVDISNEQWKVNSKISESIHD